jgi:hypothetical protein
MKIKTSEATCPAQEIRLLVRHPDLGREAWIKWDEGAELYELFASENGDDYIGCADTVSEARTVAAHWFNELMSY